MANSPDKRLHIPAPEESGYQPGENHLLLIGIEQYHQEAIHNLSNPARP